MRVLVTGKTSKLSNSFLTYVKDDKTYECELISLRGEGWKEIDFSSYDAVLHCAGLYRSKVDSYDEYYKVNVSLTMELMRKCIRERVTQFVYISTMDIYTCEFGAAITSETRPNPSSYYGKSKWEAENLLQAEVSKSGIQLAIIRCCPVIGVNAESNLEGYRKALTLPLFPDMFSANKRSILHVDTLSELIKNIISKKESGVYFPQNSPALSVADIVREIKKHSNAKTRIIKIPRFLWVRNHFTERYFWSCYYDEEISNHFGGKYSKMSSYDAIRKCIFEKEGFT